MRFPIIDLLCHRHATKMAAPASIKPSTPPLLTKDGQCKSKRHTDRRPFSFLCRDSINHDNDVLVPLVDLPSSLSDISSSTSESNFNCNSYLSDWFASCDSSELDKVQLILCSVAQARVVQMRSLYANRDYLVESGALKGLSKLNKV